MDLETNKELSNYITTYHSQLDNIYIDKFWSSINNKQWIYADDILIEWVGYHNNCAKQKYTNLIKDNFKKEIDYKTYDYEEINNIFHSSLGMNENNKEILEFKDKLKEVHNRTIHLILSPKCFKKSLMMIRTEKADKIREYYIDIEEVCLEFNKFLLENKNKELEEEKEKNKKHTFRLIQEKILELEEYIYIAASKNSSELNRFKIGMTKHIDSRIDGYNTGRVDDDKFYYVYFIKCYDCESLEKMIFNRLSNYQYIDNNGKKGNEMYQIHYNTLIQIFKEFEQFEIYNSQNLNKIFTEYYHTYQTVEPTKFKDIQIINIQEHINSKYNNNSIIINTRSKLNNKNINENLESRGIKLISNYNGNYEEEFEFECLSIFKHKFKMTYAHMQSKKEKACYYCTKHGILDGINLYAYDKRYNFHKKYESFNNIKLELPDINHQIIKNIIREKRWFCDVNGFIYSILEPDILNENKLNLEKKLTNHEKNVINILNINYETIKNKLLNINFSFIYAIDDIDNKIYCSKKITQMGRIIYCKESDRLVNRKTIKKYLNTNDTYAGYLWVSNIQLDNYTNYEIINLN